MDHAFWRGRRVLVTGHTGFKGAWLSLWLKDMGAIVTGYALSPPTDPSLFDLINGGAGLHSVLGDLSERDRLTRAVAECQPEIVFHLAAQPLVRAGYDDPVATFQSNVMGTLHLLEAVRAVGGVRALVNVTTDKCYDNREWCWPYRESDALGGFDPYSNSKACSELVTQCWRNAFFPTEGYEEHGVAIATARAGNVIGGGDWGADRLIPDFVRASLSGKSLLLRNPDAVRPWQHVLEPLAGYLKLARALYERGPEVAEAWNFGPGDEDARPVKWLIEHASAAWPGSPGWQADTGLQPHEANTLKLDCSKARQYLGWSPRLDLKQALEWTISWYQAWQTQGDLTKLCRDQIARYEALAVL